jgi:hypothetical protein
MTGPGAAGLSDPNYGQCTIAQPRDRTTGLSSSAAPTQHAAAAADEHGQGCVHILGRTTAHPGMHVRRRSGPGQLSLVTQQPGRGLLCKLRPDEEVPFDEVPSRKFADHPTISPAYMARLPALCQEDA